jgi:hypothetical protein
LNWSAVFIGGVPERVGYRGLALPRIYISPAERVKRRLDASVPGGDVHGFRPAASETAFLAERCLSSPIQKRIERQGYAVIPQFGTFSLLTDRDRKLDLLGFRWTDGDNLDARVVAD